MRIEQRLVRVGILSLLLAVGLPDPALEAVLPLVPRELVAAVPIVFVVIVRGLQDRVVLCLHVAWVAHGDILVESVVTVVVLV